MVSKLHGRCNNRMEERTCDVTEEFHMLVRRKHGTPVILASGSRRPWQISILPGNGHPDFDLHGRHFGQQHETAGCSRPCKNKGVYCTGRSTTVCSVSCVHGPIKGWTWDNRLFERNSKRPALG